MKEFLLNPEGLFHLTAIFSLGSTVTAALYHAILYFQRRERILIQFCNYLFFVSLFTAYRLFLADQASDTILYGNTTWFMLVDEPMQMMMYYTYIAFIGGAVTADRRVSPTLIRFIRYILYFLLAYSCIHVGGILLHLFPRRLMIANVGSRVLLIIGGSSLIVAAWRQRKSIYYRYLLSGGIAATVFGMLAFLSFNLRFSVWGIQALSFTFIGTFLSVLFFSAAIGQKLKEFYQRILEVRLKISQDLHDQVGATLTSISFLSEVAINQAPPENTSIRSCLDKIGAYSREMISEMNDIVWAINPSNDKFDKLTDRMQNFALPLLSSRNVEFRFSRDVQLNEVSLDMQQRKNLYLIFKEAINNAAKYAECRNVQVKLDRGKEELLLDILDDGKGIPQETGLGGNGLKNMKHRAEELKGKLIVDSGKDKGTRIRLQIPITQIAD